MDAIVELTKSLASSDFEVSKSSPNDPNKPHPRFSQYKNRNRPSDQGKFEVTYVVKCSVGLDFLWRIVPTPFICINAYF